MTGVYCGYLLKLSSTTPVIRGTNITFHADLLDTNGNRPTDPDLEWVSIAFISPFSI